MLETTVGVEVDLDELRDDQVDEVGSVEPVDLGVEVELLDDVPGGFGVSGDVASEVVGDVVRVGEHAGEGEWESRCCRTARRRFRRGRGRGLSTRPLQLLVPGQHVVLGRFEDAVEAS